MIDVEELTKNGIITIVLKEANFIELIQSFHPKEIVVINTTKREVNFKQENDSLKIHTSFGQIRILKEKA